MDQQTSDHLFNWIAKTVTDDQRLEVASTMLSFLHDYPDLVNSRTWDEIRTLAERY